MEEKNNSTRNKTGNSAHKWMVAGIVLLVLIIAVTWYLSSNKGGMQEGTVVIKAGDTILGSFTAAELQKFPAAEKRLVIIPGCGGDCKSSGSDDEASQEHNYTGTPLLEVLNSIDPGLTQKYKKVITRGIDYYSQVMEMSEIEQADNVYIVYSDNGQPLKTKAGGDGSLSLVVCSDQSGQRFTEWLVSLELQ
jgi:hypothetical protein